MDTFGSKYTGPGNDTRGSGFYMTDSKETAESYGSQTAAVELDIRNPICVNNKNSHVDNEVTFTRWEAMIILTTPTRAFTTNPITTPTPPGGRHAGILGETQMDARRARRYNTAIRDKQPRRYSLVTRWITIPRGGHQLALGKGVQKVTRQGGVIVGCNDNTKAHVARFPQSR